MGPHSRALSCPQLCSALVLLLPFFPLARPRAARPGRQYSAGRRVSSVESTDVLPPGRRPPLPALPHLADLPRAVIAPVVAYRTVFSANYPANDINRTLSLEPPLPGPATPAPAGAASDGPGQTVVTQL